MYSRQRVFDESEVPLTVQPSYRIHPQGTVLNWTSLACRRFPDQISEISDVVGNPRGNNPVHHWQLDSQTREYPKWYHTFDAGWGEPRDAFLFFPIQAFGLNRIRNWPWLPDMLHSAVLTGWSLDAFKQFTDQVPVSVSLPNFIYELKDMKGMIPTFDRKHLSKTASNNFLAWEFGVQPFVSDVKAMVNMAATVQKRLQHLRSANNAASRLSFKRELVQEEPLSFFRALASFGTSDNGSTDGILFKRQSVRTNVHIGCSLYMALKGLDDALSTMKGLLASGGFNHPARVVWNAIPYSFVVDWFFHVGKLLDTLSVQPFEGEYSLSNVWYSVKNTSTWLALARINDEAHYPFYEGTKPLVGTVHVKSYDRLAGFPVTNVALTDGTLSPMQLALALAMLEQRRR